MGWLVAAVVVVALGALVWWSSGRSKPDDLRLRHFEDRMARGREKFEGFSSGSPIDGGPSGF